MSIRDAILRLAHLHGVSADGYEAIAAVLDQQPQSNASAALENCRLYAARHRREEWAKTIVRFCAEGGSTGNPLRSEQPPLDPPGDAKPADEIRRLAAKHASDKGCAAFALPDGRGLVIAYGRRPDILRLLGANRDQPHSTRSEGYYLAAVPESRIEKAQSMGLDAEWPKERAIPTITRPTTGRAIPDLTGVEHVCQWQGKIHPESNQPQPGTITAENHQRAVREAVEAAYKLATEECAKLRADAAADCVADPWYEGYDDGCSECEAKIRAMGESDE